MLSQADIPKSCNQMMGSTHGERINSLICDILLTSFDQPVVSMSPEMHAEFTKLRSFMFERVYLNHDAKKEEAKDLFEYVS